MLRKALSPIVLLPSILVAPYVYFGPYGITLAELSLVIAFFYFAFPALLKGSFGLPKILLVYLVLFFFGWMGGVVNGSLWAMPIGPWNLNFFYKVMLVIAGYYIGHRLYRSMDDVITSNIFKSIIVGLATIAMLFPFVSYEMRVGIMRLFINPTVKELNNYHTPIFRGLGINANIYSFMVYFFLLFAFDAYLRGLIRGIYPLLALIIIVSLSSKLGISLAAGSCLLLLVSRSISAGHRGSELNVRLSKRAISKAVTIFALIAMAFLYLTRTSVGDTIVTRIAAFSKITDAATSAEEISSVGQRLKLWKLGLQRVELAPIAGIVRNRYVSNDYDPLMFTTPHNEFIEQWMFYGLLGMVAHIVLVVGLTVTNLRRKGALMWCLLYPALLVHMTFDGAFEYVRFYAMFFMIVGINMRALTLCAPKEGASRPANGYGGSEHLEPRQ